MIGSLASARSPVTVSPPCNATLSVGLRSEATHC